MYLQCLPVQRNGLLYMALLSLDVGQIVEGVGMVRIHTQGCVVAFLSLAHLIDKHINLLKHKTNYNVTVLAH